MWTCEKCGRIFDKQGQMHSCKKVALEEHFKNKQVAKELFDELVTLVNKKVGKCKIVSLPCCVHLFGKYDFLAALPKKDRLEVRFALNRELQTKRLKVSVPVSLKAHKHCFDIALKEEFDKEFVDWVKESYNLKG